MIITHVLLASLVAGSPVDGTRVCDQCGIRWGSIDSTIVRLKCSPRSHDREDAAEALGRVRWNCHPEVVHALADALRFDPKDDVREEAAVALGRMGACDPEAHFALRKAAVADHDLGVRRKSRKALASLPSRCVVDCVVCGPSPVTPSKRLLADGSYIKPGLERIIESTPSALLDPVELSPSPRNQGRSSAVVPEDAPPPPPTPVIIPLPGVDRTLRRTSAKPVIPPAGDLPPLEGPMR